MRDEIENFLVQNGHERLDLKAVFFDMDGVLFDSMPFHVESWIKTLNHYDIPFSANEAYMCEGRTGASTITEYYTRYKGEVPTEEKIAEIYAMKSSIFQEISVVRKIEGVSTLIDYLKSQALELYVVTGSGQKTLLDTLNKHFPNTFARERIISAYDVKKGKPDPEPYLIALERAALSPSEAMVVENAPLGVKSSSAAGVFTVAVNTGTLPDDILYEYGANVVYPTMSQLLNAIKSLNNNHQ